MKRIFASFFLFSMISLVIWNYVFSPLANWMVEKHLDRELNQYYAALVHGVYTILLEELKELPPDQWDDYIQYRQPQFSYPLSIEPIASLNLEEEKLARLKNGEIVVKIDADLFYQRLGDSDQVVTMGPIRDYKTPLRTEALLWSMIVVFFGLTALFWALQFWLKLRRISIAAESFGKGDFSARAKMPKHSALFPLAKSFNNMAEQIQRLIRSHKELTQAVSHELRTPISRIRFGMEMLETADDTKERHRNISEVNKDVDELDTLVSELLAYAQFDREKPPLNPVELPLALWMADIAEKADKGLPQIQLRYHIPPENQQYRTSLDPYYMSRALNNLIQNAMKHASQCVEIRFEKKDGLCLIHVDDDGPGIPEADQKRIFEPFVRLDVSRSRDTGGHGLGLAIVRQIMAWHDGEAVAGKSPLGGARFTILWPEDRQEHAEGPANQGSPASNWT